MTDLIKVIIIGESGVGKSNIMTRYIMGEFISDQVSTIGVEFYTKRVNVFDREINIQIWDTAGQERFRAITRSIYHGAKAVIIVYDITNAESFNSIESWVLEAKNHVHQNAIMCLVGNKNDLEHLRLVPEKKAFDFAKKNNMLFFETSAASNKNISLVFDDLIKQVIESNIDIAPKKFEAPKIYKNVDLKNPNKDKEENKNENKKGNKCKCN